MEAEQLNALANTLADLSTRTRNCGGIFDYDVKEDAAGRGRRTRLEDPKIWDDAEARAGTRPGKAARSKPWSNR